MDACDFVDGLSKADFFEDKRTQQAVIMSLIIIGEAATKIMDNYIEFSHAHAHGYFDINLDVVWDTVQTALPDLLKQLPAARQNADVEDRKDQA